VPKKSARTFRTNFRRPNQTIRRNELILSESSGEPAAFKRIGVAASVLSTPAELSCVKKLGHETSPRKRQYSLMARQPWRPRSPISALPRKRVESRCDAVALGSDISVAAPFVWRCLTGPTMSPFSHPAHRTGQADFPHPALGQNFTPSPTARRAQAGSGVRAQSARIDAGVDRSRPCVA
jgi:hypothetical protein